MNLVKTKEGNYTHADDPGEQTALAGKRRSVTDEEAEILGRLAKGQKVLEIGTGLGVSTRAMIATADDVVTIDPDTWVQENIWPSLDCRKYGSLETFFEDNLDTDRTMVFIDGDHSFKAVKRDLIFAFIAGAPGATIIMHDSNFGAVDAVISKLAWVVKDFGTKCKMVQVERK